MFLLIIFAWIDTPAAFIMVKFCPGQDFYIFDQRFAVAANTAFFSGYQIDRCLLDQIGKHSAVQSSACPHIAPGSKIPSESIARDAFFELSRCVVAGFPADRRRVKTEIYVVWMRNYNWPIKSSINADTEIPAISAARLALL